MLLEIFGKKNNKMFFLINKMSFGVLFVIIITLLLLTILIMYVIIPLYLKNSQKSLKSMFLDKGLLVNNFGTVWFETMLQHGDVALADTAVCASVNRHTCTAYSLIKPDLIPMFFMFPGVNLNVPCGIILDPTKVWPLITLMAVVDGDTNNRSCCTNESYGPILTRSPFSGNPSDMCIYNTLLAKYGPNNKYVTGKYAVYIPAKDSGGGCPTSCGGDLACMYQNSGGNINQWLMNSSPECIAGQYKDCFDFTEIASADPAIVKIFDGQAVKPDGYLVQSTSDNCATCKKPYLCVFDEYKQDERYKMVFEDKRIATYIGKDGVGFQASPASMDIGKISITQCRFEKKDWNKWIDVLRQHYRRLLSIMKQDNSINEQYNYQMAHPFSPSYFENEVNLYIDPNTTSDDYKSQNSTWQDSIVGFYYTATPCEDQLQILNGVPATAFETTFNNSTDRCDKFFQMDNPALDTSDKRRQWEMQNMAYSRELVHKVTSMFNEKHGKNLSVYKCTADSNSFPNYQSMVTALEGKTKLKSIFQKDTAF